MIRCDQCERPCGAETVEWEERHGFSFGPFEQWAEQRSDCCGAEVYDDGVCCPHDQSLHIDDYCPVIGCHCGDASIEPRRQKEAIE
jgi:hypothetical protein